ncbi:MAG: MarR family transcriptional regulator [Pseudomonadota bacterium]
MQPTKTDKDGKLKVQQQLCFALYSTSRFVTKAYSVLLEELGVTYPQYVALLLLWQEDGILVSEIANALEIDGGTATPMVQRLEKLGLVTRIRCHADERRVRVYLTEKGKEAYKKALQVPQGLGEATGLDSDTAHRVVDEMNEIKSHISEWLENKTVGSV